MVGVLLKKKFHVLGIFVYFAFFLKLGPRENLKISQCFAVFLFVCLFVCFFVPRGKSSVSSLGCFCCFFSFLNFLLGCLLYSGCSSFTCSGFTNVEFKRGFEGQGLRARLCCRKISDSIFWLYYFTTRWLTGTMPCPKKVQKKYTKRKDRNR